MTKYEDLLRELKENVRRQAREWIPKLCYALRDEDAFLTDEDIKDRIRRDLAECWSRATIFENIPDEFKNKPLQEAGRKSKKNVRETMDPVTGPKRQDEIVIAANGSSSNKNTDLSDDLADPVDAEMMAADNNRDGDGSPTEKAYRAEIEGLKMDNDRLQETLNEKQQEIMELIKSINAAGTAKKEKQQQQQGNAVKDSVEYKALLSELNILKQERDELRELARDRMKANPEQTFQNASTMKAESLEVTFDAKELSTFFLDTRIAKQVMYLQVKDGKVVGWESDAKRQKS